MPSTSEQERSTSGEELHQQLLHQFRNALTGSELEPLERVAIQIFIKWMLKNYRVLPLDLTTMPRLDDIRV